MAAPAPVQPVPQQQTRPGSYTGPGEAALQHGADQILVLIEHEKQNAVRQRDDEINHLRSQLQAMQRDLQNLETKRDSAQQQHDREKQAASEELQEARKDGAPNNLQPIVDALLRERDTLRESLGSTRVAVEQMGIHSAGPGLYGFAAQWADLFNELGIAGGVPWRPDQLLAVVTATVDRLRLHRGDAPRHVQLLTPNLADPFVIEAELNRARRYVSRLEEKQSEIQARPLQQPSLPHPIGLPTPPVPT